MKALLLGRAECQRLAHKASAKIARRVSAMLDWFCSSYERRRANRVGQGVADGRELDARRFVARGQPESAIMSIIAEVS